MKRFSMSTNNIGKLTKQQQTVVDSNDTTVLVNAVAGSGKTSTLMYLAEKYEKGIYLAFNKAIVGEVIPKLPVGWTCKTFNAFGLSLVKQHYPTSRVNFQKYDKYKMWGGQTCSILASKHMNMNGNIAYTSWKDTCDRFQIGYQFIDDAQELLEQGKEVIVTEPKATRFFWTIDQAVDLIFECMSWADDAKPYVPDMK